MPLARKRTSARVLLVDENDIMVQAKQDPHSGVCLDLESKQRSINHRMRHRPAVRFVPPYAAPILRLFLAGRAQCRHCPALNGRRSSYPAQQSRAECFQGAVANV